LAGQVRNGLRRNEYERTEKQKRVILKYLYVFNAVFIVAVLMVGHFNLSRDLKSIESVINSQAIQIEANSKQIPIVAKYIKLVGELADASKGKLTPKEIVEIARIITEQSRLHQDIGLSPELIMGIMQRESGFDPDAFSHTKDYGLMQMQRLTFSYHLPELGYERFSEELAMNPIVNVEAGILELVRLRKYWLENGVDNWMITISSYHWGTRNVWQLLSKKGRAELPSLEYGRVVLVLSQEWKKKGL